MFVTTTQGYKGYRAGLLAFRFNAACKLALVWRQGLGSSLDSVPTIANDTVMVNTGAGKLRIFSTATGKPLASLPANGVGLHAADRGRRRRRSTTYRQVTVFRLKP